MHREVLGSGHHMVAIDEKVIALQAFDSRHAHARNQVGVFAIGLFGPAPARIAGDIQIGRVDLPHTARAGFVSNGGKDALDQRRVPGGCQSQRLRKAGAAVLHQPVQGFTVEQHRNA